MITITSDGSAAHPIDITQVAPAPLPISTDWLEHVIYALDDDAIADAFQGTIPANTIRYLTERFGQAPPLEETRPVVENIKQFATQHQQVFSKRWLAKHGQDRCVICQDSFKPKNKIIPLPICQHTFHKKCISTWLSKHSATCPLCKKSVLPPPL